MSVRMRHTRSHTKNRRSHHALAETNLVKDEKSGSLRLPHRLDETTGMYRGKQIVSTEELKRREARLKAKEQVRSQQEETPVEGMRDPIAAPQEENKPAPASKVSGKKEGLLGRFTKGRAKARSGFGGGSS